MHNRKMLGVHLPATIPMESRQTQCGWLDSASVCTICRSLRSGVEDWLFVAVGSKYLRLCGALIAAALVADIQAMGLER